MGSSSGPHELEPHLSGNPQWHGPGGPQAVVVTARAATHALCGSPPGRGHSGAGASPEGDFPAGTHHFPAFPGTYRKTRPGLGIPSVAVSPAPHPRARDGLGLGPQGPAAFPSAGGTTRASAELRRPAAAGPPPRRGRRTPGGSRAQPCAPSPQAPARPSAAASETGSACFSRSARDPGWARDQAASPPRCRWGRRCLSREQTRGDVWGTGGKRGAPPAQRQPGLRRGPRPPGPPVPPPQAPP